MDYLKAQEAANPEQKALFSELGELFRAKLFHQLSEKLMGLIEEKDGFFQKDSNLLRLYENFVSKFNDKINQLELAHIAIAAAQQQPDEEAALKFMDSLCQLLATEPEALALARLHVAKLHMKHEDKRSEVQSLLDQVKQAIDDFSGIMVNVVHSTYHRVAMQFYSKTGVAEKFFEHALAYLSYTPLDKIPTAERLGLAAEVGTAAIVGTTVYNFGELLQHPVVGVLESSSEHKWLHTLLFAFNAGDIKKYEQVIESHSHSADSKSTHVLSGHRSFLNQKIRIMALMEFVFNRPSHQRTFTFEELAQACQVPLDKLEPLLMKAFSIKVVKGSIDEVEQKVRIKWVQPRVLSIQQISTMKDRLKDWGTKVSGLALYIESSAPEIIVNSSS